MDVKSKLLLFMRTEIHKLRKNPHPSWPENDIGEALKIVDELLADQQANDNK